jgi:hypothetical protein
MRKIAIVLVVVILAALTFAQTGDCPEQTWMSSTDVPFTYDPNQVHLDAFTGERALLGYLIGDTGRELVYDGYACDPDENVVVFTVDRGTLEHPTPDTFTWRWVPVSAGLHYVNIHATDVPQPHQSPLTRTGTLVILSTRPNNPPVLCGGRP